MRVSASPGSQAAVSVATKMETVTATMVLSLWRALGVTFGAGFALCLPAQQLKLSTDPWIAWAPAQIAADHGFWQQRGVTVVLHSYADGDSVQAFVAKQADFGLMMAGTAIGLQASGQADVVVLAEVDWSHGGDKMVGKKGKSLAELKGKRIGIYEDSPAVMMFLAAKLKAEGLRIADFKVVVVEDMDSLASQFLAGRLACAISYDPYVAKATANGACEVIATTADFPGVMPEVLVAHREVLARIPPGQVAALLAGWIDAVEWSVDPLNEAAFAKLCATRVFATEKVSVESIPELLKNVRIHGPNELRERNLTAAGLETFLRECARFAARTGKVDVARMFDRKPLERALELRSTTPAAAPAK